MKLDKAYIEKFEKYRVKYDTKQALMILGDDLAKSFLAPVTKEDVKHFEAIENKRGIDYALHMVISTIGNDILNDLDKSNIKPLAKKKTKQKAK